MPSKALRQLNAGVRVRSRPGLSRRGLSPDKGIAASPMDELPRFVRDLIATFPHAGHGVHRHLFRLARYLHAWRSEPDIFALLRAASHGCGRKVSDQEIHDAILNSRRVAWRPWETGRRRTSPKGKSAWPARQHARIDELVRRGAGLYDLWESSPLRLEPTVTPEASRLTAATSGGRSEPPAERIIDAPCSRAIPCCAWPEPTAEA
jgi:hypothetical protein